MTFSAIWAFMRYVPDGHLARILGRLRLEFAIRQQMQLRDGAIIARALDLHGERGRSGVVDLGMGASLTPCLGTLY